MFSEHRGVDVSETLWDRRLLGTEERRFESETRQRHGPPNILWIMADDLGWGDLGCYGSLHNRTPVLDELARQGLRFTHAYAGSATCSPTRVSLYTGRYPGRLEVGLEEPLRTRSEQHGIPTDHPTLPSMLAAAGYQTAMFGKWHCGWLPWFSPLRIGFDQFFGNLDGAMDYFTHVDTVGQSDLYEGETPIEMHGYYTTILAERAAAFVRERRADPFYLQLNFTAPHWPWEGPDDEPVGRRIRDEVRSENSPVPMFHFDGGSLAKYAEMVEAMDTSIGEVLDALDASGQADNTIVLFTSDNGGERFAFQWPFVGEKGDLTEGGIRVPLILRWPVAVGARQVSADASITMDWTATLLDLAGAETRPEVPLDGRSLAGWLLEGCSFPDHDLFWRTRSQGALRRGRYKYLRDQRDWAQMGSWPLVPNRPPQLFDMWSDGRERVNLARRHPELVSSMSASWDDIEQTLLRYEPAAPSVAGVVTSQAD
jgi:arylsulfatase A-like enzyme